MDCQIVLPDILNRLTNLEGDKIDWITLCISIGSIVVAVATIIVTIVLNRSNSKQNVRQNEKNEEYAELIRQEGNLNAITVRIDAAKTHMQFMELQIVKITETPENSEIMKAQKEAAIAMVLDAFEGGCDAFFKNKINKQDFVDKYDHDIELYIKDYESKFRPPFCMYQYMLKYHKKYYMNKKVKESAVS